VLPISIRRLAATRRVLGAPRARRGGRAPLAAIIPLALFAALAAGCASADPSSELRDAAHLVGSRAAIAPDWPPPAGDSPLPDPLDLAAATRRAIERHPTLLAEVAAVARARADFAQADRLPNPTLRLAFGLPIDGGGGEPFIAGVMAPLAALWTRPARLAAADAELRRSVLSLAERALRAIEMARTAFAAVHHGREREALDLRAVSIAEERLALVESLARAGEADRAAVEESRIELARRRDRAFRSGEERAVAERTLLELIGEAGRAECPALDPAGLAVSEAAPSEKALIPLASSQRLDVAAARAGAEAAEESLSLARRERFGDSEVRLEYERDMEDRELLWPGIDLDLPIFDPGDARIASAAAEAERARREAEAIESEAIREVRSAHARFTGARDRLVAIEREWLAAARSRARLAAETAAAGEMSRTESLSASIEEIEAEREWNDAALEMRAARFELERAAGGTLVPMVSGAMSGTGAGSGHSSEEAPSQTGESSGREWGGMGQAPAEYGRSQSPFAWRSLSPIAERSLSPFGAGGTR